MVALLSLVTVLTGATLGSVILDRDRAALKAQIMESQFSAAQLGAQFASFHIAAARADTSELAARPSVVQSTVENEPEQLKGELTRFADSHPEFDGIAIFDESGRQRVTGVANPQNPGGSAADRDWFVNAMASRKPYLGMPVVSRATGTEVVPYGTPILDEKGEPRGVLAAGVSLTTLSRIITRMGGNPDIRPNLIDLRGEGTILAHIDPARILQPPSGKNQATTRLLLGESGSMQTRSSSGEDVLASFVQVPDLPWGVVILTPAASALLPIDQTSQEALKIGMLAVLAATLVGLCFALQITRPLVQLRNAANSIAQGDLSLQLGLDQKDEIGDLGRALDQMAMALSQRAAALESANADLATQATQLAQLSDHGHLLQTCRDSREAYQLACRGASQLFPGSSGTLWVSDGADRTLNPASTWGRAPAHALITPDSCIALRLGRPHLSMAADAELSCGHLKTRANRGYLCVPLSARGDQVGVLCITVMESGAQALLSSAATQLAAAQANQLALVLHNLALQESLRSDAIRDPLTGLFNRRYLEPTLDREVSRAHRHKRSLSVLMFDLDYFKRVNDRLGHAAGDTLLRDFSQLLSSKVRGEDIVARYGGEEFLLVLPNTSPQEAAALAEDLRIATKALSLGGESGGMESVSVSVGVATCPVHGTDPSIVLEAADRALYQAKSLGRDRVVVADEFITPMPRPVAPARRLVRARAS